MPTHSSNGLAHVCMYACVHVTQALLLECKTQGHSICPRACRLAVINGAHVCKCMYMCLCVPIYMYNMYDTQIYIYIYIYVCVYIYNMYINL